MAWELQSHMHGHIAPSVYHAAQKQADSHQWLAERWADQRWCEETGQAAYDSLVETAKLSSQEELCEAIAQKAIEHAATTNGGWEVYLDGWTSVPWCTEEQVQEWYG